MTKTHLRWIRIATLALGALGAGCGSSSTSPGHEPSVDAAARPAELPVAPGTPAIKLQDTGQQGRTREGFEVHEDGAVHFNGALCSTGGQASAIPSAKVAELIVTLDFARIMPRSLAWCGDCTATFVAVRTRSLQFQLSTYVTERSAHANAVEELREAVGPNPCSTLR